jgi:hypothetical protein
MSPARLAASALALLAAFLIDAAVVRAQPVSVQPVACPGPANLLAGKAPYHWNDLRGGPPLSVTTDGTRAPEGAIWDAPLAIVLDTGAATISWDLGAVYALTAIWAQADANDTYTVWGSTDGNQFTELGRIEPVTNHGLRGRSIRLTGAPVRYLRFGEGDGDTYYSLSEIQAFCQVPQVFPPDMKVGDAKPAQVARTWLTYWNDTSSARWEFVLALMGLALLQWGLILRRNARPEDRIHLRNRLLGWLGLLAALTYINFGAFHFPNFIHTHEWVHYYVGSKYFPELSYTRLYECLSVADVEDGLRRRVEKRRTTDLRTNVLTSSHDIIAHPERCKAHFSEARWRDFKHDVAFFRARLAARTWDDIQLDHGYNATPVWNVAGTLLSNLAPASNTQLYLLALLDPIYLAATIAVIWWAFGWQVLSVALLVFATNFPSRFYWTGGSFLRWDWLFYTIAAICCLRKQRFGLAGASLAYAAGLRVFPIFLFLGPVMAVGWHFLEKRFLAGRPSGADGDAAVPGKTAEAPADGKPPGFFARLLATLRKGWAFVRSPQPPAVRTQLRGYLPGYRRFFVTAAITGTLLFGVSLAVSGGVTSYRDFAANTSKHKETPLVNNLGIRTVLSWRPSEVGRHTNDSRLTDPWAKWKEARLKSWKQALPVYAVLALAWLVLLGVSSRGNQPWVAAALGLTFVPVATELTSYYFAFLLGVALLVEQREQVGRWLLLMTAFTQFVAWAPLRGMSHWGDEQYTLMAAATMAILGAILWIFRRPIEQTALSSTAWAASSSPATAPSPGKKKRSRG